MLSDREVKSLLIPVVSKIFTIRVKWFNTPSPGERMQIFPNFPSRFRATAETADVSEPPGWDNVPPVDAVELIKLMNRQ